MVVGVLLALQLFVGGIVVRPGRSGHGIDPGNSG